MAVPFIRHERAKKMNIVFQRVYEVLYLCKGDLPVAWKPAGFGFVLCAKC